MYSFPNLLRHDWKRAVENLDTHDIVNGRRGGRLRSASRDAMVTGKETAQRVATALGYVRDHVTVLTSWRSRAARRKRASLSLEEATTLLSVSIGASTATVTEDTSLFPTRPTSCRPHPHAA